MPRKTKTTTTSSNSIDMTQLTQSIMAGVGPLIKQAVDGEIRQAVIEQDDLGKACDKAYVQLIEDVAKSGVRLVTIRGRRGPQVINMSEEAKAFIDSCVNNNKSWTTKRFR